MQTGSQLTLFAHRGQHHGHRPVVEWILDTARRSGVHGATVIEASEGVDMHGHVHAAHFFELADEPALVVVVADDAAIDTLLANLADSGAKLFYTRSRVEFGRVGDPH